MDPAFTARSWFSIDGRGTCATVGLDRESEDYSHLIGHRVVIDGRVYECTGVERRQIGLPPYVGEEIGLWVK